MTANREVLRPVGGVDERKYALEAYALALLRGYLSDGRLDLNDPNVRERLLNVTSLGNMAAACGYTEAELAISWSDFLSDAEKEAVRCGAF